MEDNLIKNKVVLITGGTSGIGKATAILLAQKGAKVYICGRNREHLENTLAHIVNIGGKAMGMAADVSKARDVKLLFNNLYLEYQGIDILINNAAIGARSITNTSDECIEYDLGVDLLGYLLCAKYALKTMLRQKSGHIINIGSMSANTRDADTDIYCAAKAGIQAFNESLRQTVNDQNIKVTLIESGTVGTCMIDESEEEKIELEREMYLLKPEDIAEIICYILALPERSDILTVQIKPRKQNI